MDSVGGRALNELGGLDPTALNQTPNADTYMHGSERVGDKLHSQKRNNSDHQLRSLRRS